MPEGFHNGYRIPEFKEGDRERTPQSATAMNQIVRALNVLLNPKIQRGTSDSDVISEAGHVITLKGTPADSSGIPFSSGTQPLHANGPVFALLIDDAGSNEVFFVGTFSALKYSFVSSGGIGPDIWFKRSAVAATHNNLYPMPVSWFLYNSTWTSPQPFG